MCLHSHQINTPNQANTQPRRGDMIIAPINTIDVQIQRMENTEDFLSAIRLLHGGTQRKHGVHGEFFISSSNCYTEVRRGNTEYTEDFFRSS